MHDLTAGRGGAAPNVFDWATTLSTFLSIFGSSQQQFVRVRGFPARNLGTHTFSFSLENCPVTFPKASHRTRRRINWHKPQHPEA